MTTLQSPPLTQEINEGAVLRLKELPRDDIPQMPPIRLIGNTVLRERLV